MRLLHIEDQDEFRAEIVRKLSPKIKVISYVGEDANGNALEIEKHANADKPIEEQIAKHINSLENKHGVIDAVLLDTDLSGYANGISQSAIRTTCSLLGIPVFRYSKKPADTTSQKLKYLATIAREGSQSILVPGHVLKSAALCAWLVGMIKSFEKIGKAIKKQSDDKKILSPAQLLAKLVKIPSIESELMGYSGANFFFFGDLIEGLDQGNYSDRNYSTQFGYWLVNYVLLFPGPILNVGSTAAYLETHKSNIDNESVTEVLKPALYTGPFSDLGRFYIRAKLDSIAFESEEDDFTSLLESKQIPITPLDYINEGLISYYCLINDCPISSKNSVGPLDWMPRGASICRIRKDTYEKFGPWLNV